MPDPLRRRYLEFQVHAGMSLMPRWAQELTGFAHSGLAQRLVYSPHLHLTARTLRWAFGVPPWRALADERVAATGARSRTTATANRGPSPASAWSTSRHRASTSS